MTADGECTNFCADPRSPSSTFPRPASISVHCSILSIDQILWPSDFKSSPHRALTSDNIKKTFCEEISIAAALVADLETGKVPSLHQSLPHEI